MAVRMHSWVIQLSLTFTPRVLSHARGYLEVRCCSSLRILTRGQCGSCPEPLCPLEPVC